MEPKLLDYIDRVVTIARNAGEIIDQYYHHQGMVVRIKSDRTPVTDADVAAHDYICGALKELTPWPIVSEESSQPRATVGQALYWLVDPLDGTKEFIEHTDEFTVNIALIRDACPILGVIYAPVFKTVYYGMHKLGAFKQSYGEEPQAIGTRPFNKNEFLFVVSRRHSSDDLDAFKAVWPGCKVEKVGSSLKFCWIAEGRADLYIRRGPTSEWDTAAAQCIVEEAGGKVVTMQGQPLVYNKGYLGNPEFLACGDRHCNVTCF